MRLLDRIENTHLECASSKKDDTFNKKEGVHIMDLESPYTLNASANYSAKRKW